MRATSATGRGWVRVRAAAHPGGFTLVELLVVLAILGLLASALPLALNRALPARRVAVAAEEIASAVREAHTLALAQGATVIVRVQDGALVVSAQAAGSARRPVRAALRPSTSVALTDREGRPLPALVLYPDGSSMGARFAIVDGARRASVSVSELTGRVWVERR